MSIQSTYRILRGIRLVVLFCLWVIPAGYLICSLLMVWWIRGHAYTSILEWYRVTWPDAYNAEDLARKCFTVQWYDWVKTNSWLLMGGTLTVLVGYILCSARIWHFLGKFLWAVRVAVVFMVRTFIESTFKEKILVLLLFACIFLYRLYFFMAYPPQTDEAFSYLFFARQGFFLSMASYPSTNNHVFFSVICSLLNKLHFFSPRVLMRWPNIAGDLILFYGIFCIFRYWGGFQRAMAVVAGVAFCHMLSYYAVIGRGYQWQEIGAVVSSLGCWACFFSGKKEDGKEMGYSLFVVSSIVGCYINPLFIYPFLTIILASFYLLIRRKDYGNILVFAGSLLTIAVMTVIFYWPLILGSSWAALTNNEFVTGWGSWRELWDHFWMFTYDLKFLSGYGIPGMYLLLVMAVLSVYLYFSRTIKGRFYDYAALYFFASILSMAVVTLFKRIYPQERSLCFWQLALNMIFVNVCYDMLKDFFRKSLPVAVMVFLLVKITGSLKGLYWERFAPAGDRQAKIYREVEKDLGSLVRLHPANWQITDSDDLYPMFGRLYLIEHDRGGEMLFNRKEALGDVLFLPDIHESFMSLKGYVLWEDKRASVTGDFLTIYVSEALLKKVGEGGKRTEYPVGEEIKKCPLRGYFNEFYLEKLP